MNNPGDDCLELRVRKARPKDLTAVAALHRAQFSDHFLGHYPLYVLSAFYGSFLEEGIFLIAELDGRMAGFVLGGDATTLRRCRKDFARRKWLQLALATTVRPRLWVQAFKRAGMLVGRGRSHAGFESRAAWRLLSITVSETAKGRGVAGVLVDALECDLPRGSWYGLSVHDDNQRAIGFYRKADFEEEGVQGGAVYFVKRVRPERADTEQAPYDPGPS